MTFTPQPYKLEPEVVAERQRRRDEKLHQSLEETVEEIRRERRELRSTLRKKGRVAEVVKFIRWVFTRGIALKVEQAADQVTVNLEWFRPVTKVSGPVSGDALAWRQYDGMPLPNIWRTND